MQKAVEATEKGHQDKVKPILDIEKLEDGKRERPGKGELKARAQATFGGMPNTLPTQNFLTPYVE